MKTIINLASVVLLTLSGSVFAGGGEGGELLPPKEVTLLTIKVELPKKALIKKLR